ncbi:MAG: hypothetical protein MUF71_14825 [Candidatus Kapabacteria bacterium]|jgi:photosystem II stability/assembly factor-like uncharacterized protein|nr:hypothetical protein [Candidatus Kapabacteria bacterium]
MKTSSPFALGSRFIPCFVAVVVFFAGACVVSAQSGGAAWRYLGPDGANVTHIAASSDTLYALTSNSTIFRSVDGTSWLPLSSFRTFPRCISASNGRIVAASSINTFSDAILSVATFTTSTNGGMTTQYVETYLYDTPYQIALNASHVIGVNYRGISISTSPSLENFRRVLTSASVTCLASVDNIIYAGVKGGQLLFSYNLGVTWLGISLPFEPIALALSGGSTLFASSTNAVYFSYDQGRFWQQTGKSPENTILQGLAFVRGRLYAATNKGAYFSGDSGKTWQSANAGLSEQRVQKIIANDSAVFVNILNLNGNSLRTYQYINQRFIPFQIGADTLPFIQATQDFFFVVSDSILRRSKNGKDWIVLDKLPTNVTFGNISAYENNRTYYAATSDGIYRSSDSGRTWESAWLKGEWVYNFGITNDTIHAFTRQPATSFSSGYRYPIQTSVDNGRSWRQVSQDYLGAMSNVIPFRNNLYAITQRVNFIVYSALGVPPTVLYRLRGYWILEDSFQGIVRGWETIATNVIGLTSRRNEILSLPQNSRIVPSSVMTNSGFQSVLFSNPVLGSSDGQRWNAYTINGLTNTDFRSIAANTQSIFVGTNGGLYVLDAPATTTAVREPAPPFPEWRITPQPASTSLTLAFMLPQVAHVRCTLHTVLGQEIATLADNSYASGAHSITAPLQNMASGLYLCRLWVDGRVVGSKSVILAQ